MSFLDMDCESISKEVNKHVEDISFNGPDICQMHEDDAKATKKQNCISNWIQALTLAVAVLTLLATVWFGLRG